MEVISVLNLKGGVAKTTTTLNIALGLREQKKKVLLIDLDYQKSLTILLEAYKNKFSVMDLFNNKPVLEVIENDIIVAHEDLLSLDDLEPGRLKKALEPVSKIYDYVIIDNHCIVNALTLNSLIASNKLIIPSTANKLGYVGVEDMLSLLELLKKVYKVNIKPYLLFTNFNSKIELNKQYKEAIEEIARGKVYIMDTTIRHSQPIEDSQALGLNLYSYSKRSNGAKDYLEATKEIIK